MKQRREAAHKLRGFSYNNHSQVSSLNNSMDKVDMQDIAKESQNPPDFFENEQVPNQKTQTSARFYQELEFNIANDEEKIIEYLRKLLKMDPNKRTFRECMSIYKLLKSSSLMIDVVNNEGFKIAVRLCKHLVYETFEEKQFIYKEGMVSDKVYVLLNGKLGVTLKNRQLNDILTKEINKFEDFGKIEVQNNVSRNSSILALKRSEVCSIDKRTYLDILGQIKKKSSDYFIDNFKLFSCFNGLSKAQQLQLIPLVNIKYFQRNQVVFKEKEQAKHIYFIVSGDFKAYCSAVVATNDYHGEYILNTSHLTAETENLFKMRHSVRKIQLAIYSMGEIVGSEDLLSDDETRSSELVCDSERGIIFYISRQDLESRIAEDDPFWESLLDIAMFKIENKERKLEQLRDPLRKTGLNREVVLSQKRIRVSNERKINCPQLKPLRNTSCVQEQSKNINKIQIHVNKHLNTSQEKLLNNSMINKEIEQIKPMIIHKVPQKQFQNFEHPIRQSELLSSSEIYSSQQLDDVHLLKNNSFITQFENPFPNHRHGEKQHLHSHRNSCFSNLSSSTHETNADTQETTGSKGKSEVSARQNFQIMNSLSQSEFSHILPPKKFIITSKKNRIHSQEDLKTQETVNYFVQNTVQPQTHRTRGKVIRKEQANRSMDNLEFLKTVQIIKDTEKTNEEFDQVIQSQEINKLLGGTDKNDCQKEIMNNLRKKNVLIQENKEFNDVHMNYNYLRSSRIDRSSIKLHRISQKLFQDQNILNKSINDQENLQKLSQVNLKQVNNNTFIAKVPKIMSNSFFTNFKFNQINFQNNKINFIQNPRALKSSQKQLNVAKDSLNNSQNNLSLDHQTIQNNYMNNTSNNFQNSSNNIHTSSDNYCLTQNEQIESNRYAQYSSENTNRYKQIRIKKKNAQNLLNQSIL